MGAAVTIFILLSFSVFVTRVAAVVLRLTGMEESSARFQALSAFSGTGFTTGEAEMIVNYPIRRKVVGFLMVIGNLGTVTLFATLAASLIQIDGEVTAVLKQIGWLLCVLVLLWFFMLNGIADKILCGAIGKILSVKTFLGKKNYQRLLQIKNQQSVCEHPLSDDLLDNLGKIDVQKITLYRDIFMPILLSNADR